MRLINRFYSTLRDYQQECISKTIEAWQSGRRRIAVSLPVGSGKTVIFSNLIQKIQDQGKILVLAHRKELLNQAYTQISRYCPDLAHHAASLSYQRILEYFRAYDTDSKLKVWGCSATLRRHDGKSLSPTFETIEYEQLVTDMLEQKWLCPIRVHRVRTNVDIKHVQTIAGDFNVKELSKAVNIESRNGLVVETFKDYVQKQGCDSTLVFAVSIAHVEALVKRFRTEGVEAHGIDSKTPSYIRDDLMEQFKQKQFPVLVNCAIITEGVDIPNVDCIILARPTRSGVLMQQMLGRGMRLHKDKKECIVLDLVDAVRDNVVLATIPTLLGLISDPSKRENIKKFFSREDNIQELSFDPDTPKEDFDSDLQYNVQVLPPFENVFSLPKIQEDNKVIRKYTPLPWVRVGEFKWVLMLPIGKKFLTLEKTDDLFYGRVYKKNGKYTSDPELILTHDRFADSLKGLESYVKSLIGYSLYEAMIMSRWRGSLPTDKQLGFLMYRKIPIPADITKGDAADLITRCLFGAKGKAQKLETKKRKLKRSESKFHF